MQAVSTEMKKGRLLLRAADSPLLLCFLGLAATRVWLQCNMFASYVQSDDGLVTVVSNLTYGLTMLVAAALALRKRPTVRVEQAMGWVAFLVMTFATLAIIVSKEQGSFSMLIAAAFVAGIGGAVGGGMWTVAYCRLSLEQSVFYGFASLGLGSLGGLLLSFMPHLASYVVSAFMPALALLGFQMAGKVSPRASASVRPYDQEPRSSVLRLLAGVAAFSFALGIARGFPVGESVPLGPEMRIVHQVGVAVLSAFVIWWVLGARRRLSFRFLWCLEVAIVAFGMLLLAIFPDGRSEWGVAVVNIADTMMLGVLWVTLQDVSRHTSLHPYVIYGGVWAARVLFRNAGRILVAMFGASAAGTVSVVAAAACAVTVSMVLLLSSSLLKSRPLFGFEPYSPAAPGQMEGAAPVARVAGGEEPLAAGGSLADVLGARYGVSEREMEVLALLLQGRSKGFIAGELFISENTVRAHTKRIYAKLDVHSKQELISFMEQLRR